VRCAGRFPEGGRNSEAFGSDTYLCGEMIAPTIKGIQDTGVIATTRHYIANEQEHFRNSMEIEQNSYNLSDSVSANLDDRTMNEVYLWPFANVLRAGAGAVMASYNQLNNRYAGLNSYALNHLLKSELGFPGFVMTDWGGHHSGVSSAFGGLDMSMPGDTPYFGRHISVGIQSHNHGVERSSSRMAAGRRMHAHHDRILPSRT
jgi:beta-glucosidase